MERPRNRGNWLGSDKLITRWCRWRWNSYACWFGQTRSRIFGKNDGSEFTVAGPPIGGAKSGINWYAAVTPLLKHYYGTGGDLNVDEIHEVIPMTEDCGVWHPQEGVFNGHFQPREAQKINRIGQLRYGVLKVIEDEKYTPSVGRKYVVADMITGYGVAESVKHFYDIWGGNLKGKQVIVQGWGNVGSAGAYYLAQEGAIIVGIIDRVGGLIKEEGFSVEEIRDLFLTKDGNELNHPNMLSYDEVNAKIWDVKAEVFIPCAIGKNDSFGHGSYFCWSKCSFCRS
jgi:hypothetical protein